MEFLLKVSPIAYLNARTQAQPWHGVGFYKSQELSLPTPVMALSFCSIVYHH